MLELPGLACLLASPWTLGTFSGRTFVRPNLKLVIFGNSLAIQWLGLHCFLVLMTQVWSLIGELRCHKLHSVASPQKATPLPKPQTSYFPFLWLRRPRSLDSSCWASHGYLGSLLIENSISDVPTSHWGVSLMIPSSAVSSVLWGACPSSHCAKWRVVMPPSHPCLSDPLVLTSGVRWPLFHRGWPWVLLISALDIYWARDGPRDWYEMTALELTCGAQVTTAGAPAQFPAEWSVNSLFV